MKTRKFPTYEEVIIKRLKSNSALVESYLQETINEYNEEENLEALIYSFSLVAEAIGGVKKVAEKSKIDYKNLCKIFANKQIPKADNFLKLIKAFDVKLAL